MRNRYMGVFVLAINSLFILSMPACQTLKNQNAERSREEELLNTQKNVAINYINQGLPNLALRELRTLSSQYPKDPDFKNLLGLTYLAMQNPGTALSYFEESYRLAARPSVALNLSSAYIETKQYDKAIKVLRDLRESPEGKEYPYPERISHNIGLAAERFNKPKMAEKYYKLALRDNPFYYVSIMRLGQLYESTQRADLALEQYQKGREACSKCFDPIQALVTQYTKAKQPAKAVALIQEFLADRELENTDRTKARKLLTELTQNNGYPIISSTTKANSGEGRAN